jgi:hypothetical protein
MINTITDIQDIGQAPVACQTPLLSRLTLALYIIRATHSPN